MALSPLTAQLPTLVGALPDLFRRPDAATGRSTDTMPTSTGTAADAASDDAPRALLARTNDETTRLLARRAALGPLTYGRRAVPADAPAAAPVGLRGAHLDVRG